MLSDDSASELVVTVYCTNRAMLEKGHLRINGRSHKVSREFEDIAIRPYHSDRDNPQISYGRPRLAGYIHR